MSLRVWLPLNGDLHNQGISGIKPQLMGNGITWTAGKIGQAATFPNNCNSCIYMPGLKLQIFSWTCWFKVLGEGSGTSQRILSEGRDIGSVGTNIWVSKAGTTLSWSTHLKSGQITIELNRWYHVALTADGENVRLYLDGELRTTSQYTDDSDYAQSNDVFVLGKMAYSYTSTGSYFPFNGQLNDLRIYDHCLSLKEIKEIYKSLVLHIKMDGGGTANQNIAQNTLLQYSYATIKGLEPVNDVESFGWQLSEATGGSSQEIIIDTDADYNLQSFRGYAQITRNSTPHSSWGMLYYKWYNKYMITPNTWYTVSFDVYSSLVSGEINWYGICNTNALGHITDQTTRIPLQNKVKQGEWNRIFASIKTLSENDFDWDTWYNSTPSQVIYFSLSTPLFAVNNVLRLRRLKLELGKTPTVWTPNYDVRLGSYNPYDTRLPFADVSGYKHNTFNLAANTNFFNNNNEFKNYISPRYSNPTNMEAIQHVM